MSTSTPREIRCKQCSALLAKHDRDGLSIRRGQLQATVSGSRFNVALNCYRCETLNFASSEQLQLAQLGAR